MSARKSSKPLALHNRSVADTSASTAFRLHPDQTRKLAIKSVVEPIPVPVEALGSKHHSARRGRIVPWTIPFVPTRHLGEWHCGADLKLPPTDCAILNIGARLREPLTQLLMAPGLGGPGFRMRAAAQACGFMCDMLQAEAAMGGQPYSSERVGDWQLYQQIEREFSLGITLPPFIQERFHELISEITLNDGQTPVPTEALLVGLSSVLATFHAEFQQYLKYGDRNPFELRFRADGAKASAP